MENGDWWNWWHGMCSLAKLEFSSLEEIQKFIEKYGDRIYENIVTWEMLVYDVSWELFFLSFELYKKYGYPEIFKYTAEAFGFAGKLIKKYNPNYLDWQWLMGNMLFFNRLYEHANRAKK